MNKKDVQLSKSLSWLLRHGALKEGLALSSEGYLPVDEILQHKTFKGKYVKKDIERVVENNDKQRFKLRWNTKKNILEIKANQGHTITKVDDTDLVPILEPKYNTVLHGTYFSRWPKIKTQGLSCMGRLHIHLSKGTLGSKVTSGVRNNVEIYIFIDLAKALTGGIKFYESENGVILTAGNEHGFLTPNYFEKVINVKTGFPFYTSADDIKGVFSRYGKVTLERVTNKFANLTFSTNEEAQAAIDDSKNIILYGEFLNVRPYKANWSKPNKTRKVPESTSNYNEQNTEKITSFEFSDIVSPLRLDLSGTFEQQMSNILAAVRLTQEEIIKRKQLFSDLEAVLQRPWPGCRALAFGSVTTGLGIKSSDADCYIDIPKKLQNPNENYVVKAKRTLQMHPTLFSDVLAIPRANTPIVKFFHLPTKVHCDVTFKTRLGALNSNLIAGLLQRDQRFIPMAVLLKYWAKVHGISGTGKLTNYALVMMIIFYLQSDTLCLLPSVRWLQRFPEHSNRIDFWNAGFVLDKSQMPSTANKSSVLQLVGGFFEFYSKFQFDQYVVCPYTGYPIEKRLFSQTHLLPKEFDHYKFNVNNRHCLPLRHGTPMCVQDPIEQSHNVASSVSGKMAQDIQEYFQFAAKAFARGKDNSSADFLQTILLMRPKILRSRTATEYRIIMKTREIAAIDTPEWKTVIRDIMRTIFGQMLRIELYNIVEMVTDDLKEKVKFDGVVNKLLWKRTQFACIYDHLDLNLVEKQTRITDEVVRVDHHEFRLMFQLILTFTNKPKRATVALVMCSGDNNLFREFGKFFKGVILTWLKTLLAPHLKPAAADAPVNVAETIKSLDNDFDSSDSDDGFPFRQPPPVVNFPTSTAYRVVT